MQNFATTFDRGQRRIGFALLECAGELGAGTSGASHKVSAAHAGVHNTPLLRKMGRRSLAQKNRKLRRPKKGAKRRGATPTANAKPRQH